MKSARLPGKALLSIHGVASIERCLLNTLSIGGSSATVLVTSMNAEDDALQSHTLGGAADLVRGSEDDVLQRILAAVDLHKPDYVIRATGDCPIISSELAEVVLASHIESGADASFPEAGFPVGINSEVYSASALRRLREFMPATPHSEYLILYFKSNPKLFRLNEVSVPEFFRRDWRVTLDEQSDLNLFERIFSALDVGRRAIAFSEVVSFFEKNPDAAAMNSSNKLRYAHDDEFASFLTSVTRILGKAIN